MKAPSLVLAPGRSSPNAGRKVAFGTIRVCVSMIGRAQGSSGRCRNRRPPLGRALIFWTVALLAAAGGARAQPTDPHAAAAATVRVDDRDPPTDYRGSPPPTLVGALVGGGIGTGAGLLFVHDACDNDPCATGAYVLGAAVGAVALSGMGMLIGSRLRPGPRSRRHVWIGVAIGGALGAAGGITSVAALCEDDSCGFPSYASVAALGAGLLGGLGALIASEMGRGEEGVASGATGIRAGLRARANAARGPTVGLSATPLCLGIAFRH